MKVKVQLFNPGDLAQFKDWYVMNYQSPSDVLIIIRTFPKFMKETSRQAMDIHGTTVQYYNFFTGAFGNAHAYRLKKLEVSDD